MRSIYRDGPWLPPPHVSEFAYQQLSYYTPVVVFRTDLRIVELQHIDGAVEHVTYEDIRP